MVENMAIKRIACVGSGLIGHGWATIFAMKNYQVSLQGIREKSLVNAVEQIRSNLKFLAEQNLVNREEIEAMMERITITTNLTEAVRNADYIQESAPENLDLKKKIFEKIDSESPANTIIASSSSGFAITELQKVTSRPERCIIVHPFNPTHLIPLVELVPGEKTSRETVELAYGFMEKIGKVPVVLRKEVPGYIANRLSSALWREAIDLVDKGVASVDDVDKVLYSGLGIRWAIIGAHLTYHLGGGSGGIKRFIENIGPTFSHIWETMDPWTAIPSSAVEKIIEGVSQMSIAKKMDIDDIVKWRDRKLVELLKILYS
ncbi:MAG: 3-hydroxyacyl-CoA dehydrogenase NAD-binding domain-containing protein [Candidatus Bathyarchaeota archaeon]